MIRRMACRRRGLSNGYATPRLRPLQQGKIPLFSGEDAEFCPDASGLFSIMWLKNDTASTALGPAGWKRAPFHNSEFPSQAPPGKCSPMKSLVILATTAATALAGAPTTGPIINNQPPRIEPFALTEAAFSFDAGYDRGGNGSAFEWRTRAGLLIPLPDAPLPGREIGMWNLQIGVDWHRFEFDHSGSLPLPERLQSVSAIIGLELRVDDQIGALIQVRPGVYFEDNADTGSWNFPVRLGMGYRVNNRLALAVMGRYDGFAKHPFLGGAGFVWKITDTVTLSAMAPEPRITWQATRQLAIWAGGEFAGGNYRTEKLGGAVVDYTDYRAFIGTTWDAGGWKFEAAVGASFEREWDYHREDTRYHTDDIAPFVKVSAGTKW